jgi:hypothetical protein
MQLVSRGTPAACGISIADVPRGTVSMTCHSDICVPRETILDPKRLIIVVLHVKTLGNAYRCFKAPFPTLDLGMFHVELSRLPVR